MAKKQEKKEVKLVEKEFTVNFKKAFEKPRTKRAKKAVSIVAEQMKKNFRLEEDKILISNKVNEFIWSMGREKIPRRMKIKTIFDGKQLKVLLPEEKIQKKEEKRTEKKTEEKTDAEKAREKDLEEKKKEKKEMEKDAEAVAIKRGTQ